MKFPRASGVLVHPTSFPGRFGVGDLGTGARRVMDFLAAGRQTLWQVLPLGPTGYGDSPYASFSAFAGNHLLIALDPLLEQGWLDRHELESAPAWPAHAVPFGDVSAWKLDKLRQAHERFHKQATAAQRRALEGFQQHQRAWLDDYALFMALKAAHHGAPWTTWGADLVARRPAALAEARSTLAEEVHLHEFLQWLFFDQWSTLRAYAHDRGLRVIGDLAIFVAHDSADVWAHQDLFALDAAGMPSVVAGVPPDYFSPSGQRWGNPLYRWDVLAETGYAWWIERVRAALLVADFLRVDHFRGFHAYWEVPASAETAEKGRWVRGPGASVFHAISQALGDIAVVAEDLGHITPPVRRLRESLGLPGMRVLQFAFGSDAHNQYLPHCYAHDTVVYTGTHDNDTAIGWIQHCGAHERAFALRYMHSDGSAPHWDLIRLALASVADTAIIPLQDVLGLGSEARMNTPGRASGNWVWRCVDEQLADEISAQLALLTATYGR